MSIVPYRINQENVYEFNYKVGSSTFHVKFLVQIDSRLCFKCKAGQV